MRFLYMAFRITVNSAKNVLMARARDSVTASSAWQGENGDALHLRPVFEGGLGRDQKRNCHAADAA